MNLDRFLEFWSHHNQTIIQVLIVVTLLFIVALVFITLFGSKEESVGAGGGSVGLSPELEKSLQKMLENQVAAKSAVFDFSGGQVADPHLKPVSGSGAVSADQSAEVEKLKTEMQSRDKAIQDLQTQLQQAAANAGKAGGGNSAGLEARIKELEARLAEYDIISEDIADLSRYKEENEKLKQQLAGAPPPTQPSAPAATAPPAAPAAPPAAPVVAAAPQPAAPPQAAAPAQPPPAPVDTTASAAIDDDLMKEFAAAVEGQKAATAVPPPPAPTAENEDLMGQFENFVQKKEGS